VVGGVGGWWGLGVGGVGGLGVGGFGGFGGLGVWVNFGTKPYQSAFLLVVQQLMSLKCSK